MTKKAARIKTLLPGTFRIPRPSRGVATSETLTLPSCTTVVFRHSRRHNSNGVLVGGIGVSGDTSCADRDIAWRTRSNLALDFVPGGPGPAGKEDNINYQGADPVPSLQNDFSHPTCPIAGVDTASGISAGLPNTQ